MAKSLIILSILILIMCIAVQSALAAPDIVIPGRVVGGPPDPLQSSSFMVPSPVKPVSPVENSLVKYPSAGIVHSPVRNSMAEVNTQEKHEEIVTAVQNNSQGSLSYAPDRVIVKYKTSQISTQSINQVQTEANSALGASVIADVKTLGVEGLQVVSVPNSTGAEKAVELYEMNPMVEYAQPDYLYTINSSSFTAPVVINPQAVSYRDTINTKLSPSKTPETSAQGSNTESCPACSNQVLLTNAVSVEDSLTEDERYAKARAEVDEINAYVAENNLSWTAAVNPIMLLSEEAREHLKGLKHDLERSEMVSLDIPVTPMEGLPTSFDWRNNGGDYTTPIKNQGSCGSCWAFATTGAFESYKKIKAGNPSLNPNYAEQYLVSCAADQYGCNGGYFDSMAYFVNQAGSSGGTGTVTETSFPYTATTGTCKSLSGYTRYTVDTSAGETWGYVGGGNEWSIPSDDAIKTAIYLYGPVAAGVYAESTFDSYSSGILDSTASASYANHAIIIVGWGTSNGRTYWICKNSWGTSWGESGWFRIYSGRLRIGEGAAYFKYTATNPTGGTVNFGSTPSGAQIWVDGANTGMTTPYTQTSVPAGTYSVTYKLAGYTDYTTSVTVTSGQTSTVSATLTPTPTGSIGVSSSPSGARIWLDGADTSKNTPNTLSSVAVGTHSVSLVLSGYNSYATTVSVMEGNTVTVSATLTQATPGSQKFPNDPSFGSLWGLHNTGQSGGTVDADIDAPEAWSLTTGSSNVIVAVVDTGVDYSHPDLAANMIAGYDTRNNDSNPMDDNGHGTHCAGTIGAVGNNGVGVTGVNWNVKIMPLKFLSSSGSGYTSDAIEAFAWGYSHGARIFSNSWGGYGIDYALRDAINLYPDALFICASGNGDAYGNPYNTDTYPHSPSSLSNANILSVTATDRYDQRASWANYGATSVDVAAPGVSIYSTIPGSAYGYKSGTSMATPHVAGIAALVKSVNPSATVSEVKSAIMNGVDVKSGLSGKCLTGGRVNTYSSISSTTPLVARFYGIPETTVYPLTVRFFDASEGSPTTWNWNFGDGNTSTVKNPVKTFYQTGTMTIQLTVGR